VEKIVKENLKETKGKVKQNEYKIAENAYVSYVVIDIKDEDITIESQDNFPLPNIPVGAASG
jgi:uncharacterized membrane protein